MIKKIREPMLTPAEWTQVTEIGPLRRFSYEEFTYLNERKKFLLRRYFTVAAARWGIAIKTPRCADDLLGVWDLVDMQHQVCFPLEYCLDQAIKLSLDL